MKLKLTYHRAAGTPVDLVVTTDATASIADIAEEIAASDPHGRHPSNSGRSLTLAVASPGSEAFVSLDPDRAVGDSKIASGYQIRVVPEASAMPEPQSGVSVVVRVAAGADRGQAHTVGSGSHTIGRAPGNDFVLNDLLVSKSHARLEVGDSVELIDLNSANGILVDGGLVPRLTIVDGQLVVLGDSELRFEVRGSAVAAPAAIVVNASVPFNRSPRVEIRYPGTEFEPPEIPNEFEKQPFPWMLMVVPVMLGVAMYLVTRRPLTLMFVAMSPMMMMANYLMTMKRTRRQRDAAVARFEGQFERLQGQLAAEVPHERELRERETPHVGELMRAARAAEPLLWTRRPEHWSFLNVRLGTGTTLSRNTVRDEGDLSRGLPEYGDRVQQLIATYRYIDQVPVVEDPLLAGAIGVAGADARRHDVARALLAQWVTLHSPAELVVTAIVAQGEAAEYEWLKWLPHTASAHSPLAGLHLADGAATGAGLLARIEELVDARLAEADVDARRPAMPASLTATAAGAHVGEGEMGEPTPLPVVLLLVSDQAPVDRARLVQVVERAAGAGVVPLFIAESTAELPASCRTFIDLSESGAAAHFVRHGQAIGNMVPELVGRAEAMDLAMTMSARIDSGALVADASDLPNSVPLISLLGKEIAAADGSGVLDRWRQNHSLRGMPKPARQLRAPTLRALIGQAGADALHLDLRAHGPHALVGGTTGAGKSEFLQSWVLAMAAEYSPDRVSFLFVDYKGGAAFADCVQLPHCVGLVTDLSPHLVRRALVSLRAELRRREEILNAKKAKDLLDLERRFDPEAPPALIIIIDEFAALVGEVPEFVDGVVDIAQRGRSLGIHLVMATQRPAGVIKDNLRANTNLRIALRMADEADSVDVSGVADAAHFDPAVPGRALAKTGPGRLVPFQAAYAGGWSIDEVPKARSVVHELRFGAERVWEKPEEELAPADPGPNDLSRLVGAVSAAATGGRVRPPRRPWLDELETVYDLADFGGVSDSELTIGMADLPSEQRQQPAHFHPDRDGHLAVYGTGGSGKTVLLRTLATGAAATPPESPIDVYALDFASGGLRMLDALPHVGAVIPGDDSERVLRLTRMLRTEIERRGRDFSAADADSITSYRRVRPETVIPRILLLVDGFPTFRSEYEGVVGRAGAYADFLQVLAEGRQLGVHIVLTADRPASVPGSVNSRVPRRLVLRLAEETMYAMLDVPVDVLGPDSPPGRGVLDGTDIQVAVLGGSPASTDQARRIDSLARRLVESGRVPAQPVASLPETVPLADLPVSVGDLPVLGISDEDLDAIGFNGEGAFLLGGPPGSGRSNALAALSHAIGRARPDAQLHFFTSRRTTLAAAPMWASASSGPDDVAARARELVDVVGDPDAPLQVIVIESIGDFLQSPADGPLVELIKTAKRSGAWVIAENETSGWSVSWPLIAEVRNGKKGVLLQPDALEGDLIFKAAFPRVPRTEFPAGRGYFVQGGRVVRVQLPLVD